MPVWTKRVRLGWRPTVAFFEQRDAVMRALEDQDMLRQFRVETDKVSMRIGDAHHLVTFGTDQLELAALRPDADAGRLRAVAERVWESMDLRPARRIRIGIQCLEPLDVSYGDARRIAAQRLFSLPKATRHEDFALHTDSRDEELDASVYFETGIVEQAEASLRLARVHRPSPVEPDTPPSLWPSDTLPGVALFCDQTWSFEHDVETVEALFELWDMVQGKGESITLSLYEQLSGG